MRIVAARVTAAAAACRVGHVAMPAAACARASAASAAATVAARTLSARAAARPPVHDYSQDVPEEMTQCSRERAASQYCRELSPDAQLALLQEAVQSARTNSQIGVIMFGYMPCIEVSLSSEQQARARRIKTLLLQRKDGFSEQDFKQFHELMDDVFLVLMKPKTRWSNVSYSAHFRYLEEKHPNVVNLMTGAVISDVDQKLFKKLDPVKTMLSAVYGETAKTYLLNLKFFEMQFKAGTLDEEDFKDFLVSIRDALRPKATKKELYD